MNDPRFSVVIPTRERAETLPYALRTCTEQDFEDFEVIVHDNCSSPATHQAVLENKSDKVRYIRSDEPLAMTDAWERGLSFARGEYVIVIGDDDALVPHALKTLDRFLRDRSAKLVRWVRASYHWPNHPYPLKRNSVKIPLDNHGYVMSSREIISRVANVKMRFQTLPMLYNSVVHRDLISEVRAKCGRVFSSLSPDVGSGFALAYVAGEYISLESPFSIGGISGKSNGLGYTAADDPDNQGGAAVAADFKRLNEKAGREMHPRMPKVYFLTTLVGESFCTVKDKLFPNDASLDIRPQDLVRNCLAEMKSLPREYALEAIGPIKSHLANNPKLLAWFEAEAARFPATQPSAPNTSNPPRGYLERERIVGLEGADFGVGNVYDAALLCERILNYNRGGFRCEIRDFHASLPQQLRSIAKIAVSRGSPVLVDCD